MLERGGSVKQQDVEQEENAVTLLFVGYCKSHLEDLPIASMHYVAVIADFVEWYFTGRGLDVDR